MFVTKFIILIVIIYVLLLAFIFFYQRKLLYHPTENNYLTNEKLIPKIEKVRILTTDNHDLLGWFYNKESSKKIILFFHGNAGQLENRIYKLNHFKNLGMNFLIISWRGFNKSTGNPTESGLYEDAKSAVRWLKSKGVKENDIILYGESLGTAIAIEIGKNKNFSGIVLESPFTSMIEAGKKYYPYLPVKLLLKDKYESIEKIANIHSPILVMHGMQDNIVPFDMGKKIYDAANSPKSYYFSEYDNHMMDYNKSLLEALKSFIDSLN